MKFIVALTAAVSVASAASLEAKAAGSPNPYQDYHYFNHPGYKAADYSKEYGEVLPGPDFNKQVYNFNENKEIWDQNDYEERVKAEAEILVALEAMKESVMYLGYDIQGLGDGIQAQRAKIGAN